MKLREQLDGTKQVFSFTLRQFLRSRANLISLAFTMLVILASMPVMTWVQGGEVEEADRAPFASVGVSNQTDLTLDLTLLTQDEYWSGVTFLDPPQSADAGVNITFENGGYLVTVTAAEAGEELALERLQWDMVHCVDLARIAAAGVTEEQLAVLWGDYDVLLPDAAESEPLPEDFYVEVDGDELMDGFWVQYGYAIVVMMLCLLSAGYIIRAVIEEKGSKLIELLLLSVRPLALLSGKILASMVYTFVLLLAMVTAWAGSLAITAAIFGADSVSAITDTIASLLPELELDALHLVGYGAVLAVSLLLGFLTMSLIGGLSGACCNSMDDAGSASGTVTLITMAGYIAACAVSAVPGKGVAIFSSLCPVLSMFCAPVQFVQGGVGLWVLLLSWLIQLALVAALAWLSARVYADLIIYRGSRVKWRQLLRMARGGKEAAR